jgi:hypothetical protein
LLRCFPNPEPSQLGSTRASGLYRKKQSPRTLRRTGLPETDDEVDHPKLRIIHPLSL